MAYIRTVRSRWLGFIGVATVLAILVGILVYSSGSEASSPPTITKDGLTVRLTSARSVTDGLELMYSHDQALGSHGVYHISIPKIRYDNGVTLDVTSNAITSGGALAKVDAGPTNLPVGGSIDVDLGSWLVSDPTISATSNVSLNQDIADAMPDSGASKTITVSGSISANSRSYNIAELVMDRRTEYEVFHLKIVPANEFAQKTELASTKVASVTLTDNFGRSYLWIGTRTRWQEANGGDKSIAWQQLSFDGLPASTASSFSLSVIGGGNVAGPFIFEDAAVVSEDVEPNLTPEGPGSSGPESRTPSGPTGSTEN